MPLQWSQQNGYAWTQQSPRPAKPQAFSQALLARFLESSYAQETSLAEFVRAHPQRNDPRRVESASSSARDILGPDQAIRGAMRQRQFRPELHPAHSEHLSVLSCGSDPGDRVGSRSAKAAAWNQVANGMCWVDSNVFVGPSAGNVGVGIDQADELTDAERRDLLAGAAWRGAAMVCAQMDGIAGA